jgi:hypothetical protein
MKHNPLIEILENPHKLLHCTNAIDVTKGNDCVYSLEGRGVVLHLEISSE